MPDEELQPTASEGENGNPPPGKLVPAEIIGKILANNEAAIEERMGHLHNKLVGFIAEAKIPLPQVILVLQMLLKEATDMALRKYLKGA